jgi:hypothetical protein
MLKKNRGPQLHHSFIPHVYRSPLWTELIRRLFFTPILFLLLCMPSLFCPFEIGPVASTAGAGVGRSYLFSFLTSTFSLSRRFGSSGFCQIENPAGRNFLKLFTWILGDALGFVWREMVGGGAVAELSSVLPRVLIVSTRTVRKNKFVNFVGECVCVCVCMCVCVCLSLSIYVSMYLSFCWFFFRVLGYRCCVAKTDPDYTTFAWEVVLPDDRSLGNP